MSSNRWMPIGAGVGLRLPHVAEVLATRPSVPWLEIHPENFLANPHATELLFQVCRDYPISVHTVGISVGSVGGIDHVHLRRVRTLVDIVDPVLVSGHLAWSTHDGEYLNDLLPLPYDEETLRLVAAHIEEVQDSLGRPYLLENPSSYLGFDTSTMSELDFLCELVRRTGCRLLCDVSNVYLSAHNLGYDPYWYIDGLRSGTSANSTWAASHQRRTRRSQVPKFSSIPMPLALPSQSGSFTPTRFDASARSQR